MRFSIELSPAPWERTGDPAAAVERTLAQARRAEAAGFDAIWVAEDPGSWDAFALLTAIARETSRIGLATGVVNPFLRHPVSIASSVATLDRLSGGRVRLGLGRGQTEWLRRGLGLTIERPVERLEEAIRLVRAWAAGAAAMPDAEQAGAGWRSSITTGGRVAPPIMLAAIGDRAVAAAGRSSDGIIFNDLTSIPAMARAIGLAREAARAADRDPALLHFVARPGLVVTGDPIPVLRLYQRTLALISTLPGMGRGYALPGWDVDAMVASAREALGEALERTNHEGFAAIRASPGFERACAAFPDAFVAELGACGELVHIRQKVCMLRDVGISEVVIAARYLPQGVDWGHYLCALVDVDA